MNTSAARYWTLLIALLALVYGSFVLWRSANDNETSSLTPTSAPRPASSSAATKALPDGPVADFVLTDQDGKPFDSASLDGQVWVTSFFFTNCPAVCWRMNQALAAWQQTHPDSKVHFVSITCDPDNDTPAALKKYAEHFKADPARWTFLTGDMQEIQRVGQDSFKIAVVKGDHTDRACVVDRNGKVRGRFRLTEPDQAEMLDRLLTVVEAESVEPHSAAENPSEPAKTPAPTGAAAPPVATKS